MYEIDTVPLKTVNRQCSSGLQAVADVASAIRSGQYDIGEFLNFLHFKLLYLSTL